jgi:hypothetical protein
VATIDLKQNPRVRCGTSSSAAATATFTSTASSTTSVYASTVASATASFSRMASTQQQNSIECSKKSKFQNKTKITIDTKVPVSNEISLWFLTTTINTFCALTQIPSIFLLYRLNKKVHVKQLKTRQSPMTMPRRISLSDGTGTSLSVVLPVVPPPPPPPPVKHRFCLRRRHCQRPLFRFDLHANENKSRRTPRVPHRPH